MLERNPTLKGELDSLPIERRSAGFYNYPISQIADILLPRAHLVPVGEDQAPHLEMSREIARKFNRMYGEVFPEPETLIGKVGRLSGTDGKGKMSKSQGNVILLSDTKEAVDKKVRGMYTDPNRIRADIPGKVEGNPVFQYLDAFTTNDDNVEDFKRRYREGNIGDVEIKNYLSKILNDFLDPIREKRMYYKSNMNLVEEALDKGNENARKSANETMKLVRDKMKVSTYKKIW
jgi:tryptophanyl-tRNA synthetase